MAEYLTNVSILGLGGLDLHRALDQINPNKLSRMTNVVRTEEGSLTGRPGATLLTQPNTLVNAQIVTRWIYRLNSPRTGTFHRLFQTGSDAGATSSLYCYDGTTNTLLVDSGFTSAPLSATEYHPALSGDSWLFIANPNRMGKVRATDCLYLPMGLAESISTTQRFRIDEFARVPDGTIGARDRTRFTSVGFDIPSGNVGPGSPSDYTDYLDENKTTIDEMEAAGWTNNAGTGGAPSNAIDAVNKKQGAASVQFTTNVGAAAGAYYNFWNKANALNLNSVGGIAASDDDILHLWIRTDRPDLVSEFRIYFVCSSAFSTSVVPGTSASANTEAYVKAFRPSDFTPIYEVTSTTIPTSSTANSNLSTLDLLPPIDDSRASVELVLQQIERDRKRSLEFGAGRGAWSQFGAVGLPLHRRDFARIGTDDTRDWGDVVGIVLTAQINTNTTGVNIWVDDIYLTGGAGLDSSLVGNQPYDYRHIDYDPRTGDKSNPTPEQGIAYRLDSLRRGIRVTPKATGNSALRQRFFRRGGTLNNNWYYLGQNTGDGSPFDDRLSDLEIVSAGTLEIDNDQPVTTVDSGGATVKGQALASIWGPIPGQGVLFGCGDPYRPGDLYWSKDSSPGSWPNANHIEVCSPSEELMAGVVYGGMSFCLSRERMFVIYPNLSDTRIVTTAPTQVTHGLLERHLVAVGPTGIYFVAKDGIYVTQGGPEQSLTEADMRGLFHGETRNGYLPIDFTQSANFRLEIFDNELWFLYRDTSGGLTRPVMIYSIAFQFWHQYSFPSGVRTAALHAERGTTLSLLLGGAATKVFTHTGTSDDGAAIDVTIRTGALDQGLPRQDKQYGDLIWDINRNGVTVTTHAFGNAEVTTYATTAISTGSNRTRYYTDIGTPQARNISLGITWSTAAAPPTVYLAGPSYLVQPDTSELRVTDWETHGRLSDKYVKGLLLECDTGNVAKTLNLQADGATAATIVATANGRQVLEFSFAQFQGRILRISPADAVQWKLYNHRWVFDEEPLSIARWETQELDSGFSGWKTYLGALVSLRSSAAVSWTLTAYREDGTSVATVYTIPSTAGVKGTRYVPFSAAKGVLAKHVLTSSAAFWLYREETVVDVQPWGQERVLKTKPFGNDDRDPSRSMGDSGLAASRSGGALS